MNEGYYFGSINLRSDDCYCDHQGKRLMREKNQRRKEGMAANVESMFYVRETPWHGLGTRVDKALTSREALVMAGLDWRVEQKPIRTEDGGIIEGYKANIRDVDQKVLGVVSNRYKVVQNEETFAFTDALLGEDVRYETAGSLADGKRTWMLAVLPHKYIIAGDEITPYLVFMNSHDGSGAIKAAMTPIRVVCQNTLNLALATAKRKVKSKEGTISGKGMIKKWRLHFMY